jgi:hypothetical protein
MTFSVEVLAALLHAAIVAIGIGVVVLALLFIADWRGKRLW